MLQMWQGFFWQPFNIWKVYCVCMQSSTGVCFSTVNNPLHQSVPWLQAWLDSTKAEVSDAGIKVETVECLECAFQHCSCWKLKECIWDQIRAHCSCTTHGPSNPWCSWEKTGSAEVSGTNLRQTLCIKSIFFLQSQLRRTLSQGLVIIGMEILLLLFTDAFVQPI